MVAAVEHELDEAVLEPAGHNRNQVVLVAALRVGTAGCRQRAAKQARECGRD